MEKLQIKEILEYMRQIEQIAKEQFPQIPNNEWQFGIKVYKDLDYQISYYHRIQELSLHLVFKFDKIESLKDKGNYMALKLNLMKLQDYNDTLLMGKIVGHL